MFFITSDRLHTHHCTIHFHPHQHLLLVLSRTPTSKRSRRINTNNLIIFTNRRAMCLLNAGPDLAASQKHPDHNDNKNKPNRSNQNSRTHKQARRVKQNLSGHQPKNDYGNQNHAQAKSKKTIQTKNEALLKTRPLVLKKKTRPLLFAKARHLIATESTLVFVRVFFCL